MAFRFSGFCTRLKKAVGKEWDDTKVYIAKTSGLSAPLTVDVIYHTPEGLKTIPSEAGEQESVDKLAPILKEYFSTGIVAEVEVNS